MRFRRLSGIFRRRKSEFPEKKVLILEGGGMRGIFPTGVLQSFTDRKYYPFELIIGTSAGALTGCAYAADQIHLSRDAFFTKLLSGSFIQLGNIFNAQRHVLDLDWMVETVIKGREPLNETILQKQRHVIITATSCPEHRPAETVYLDTHKDDIVTALKATAAIPFLYRGFVRYGDLNLLDGGLLDPVPYRRALDLGYREDEILVVLTRPRGYRKKAESFWVRTLYESYYRDPKYSYLVASLDKRYIEYNKMLSDLESMHPGIDILYPPQDFEVDRLTKDPKKIMEGFEQGVFAANAYLMPEAFSPDQEHR